MVAKNLATAGAGKGISKKLIFKKETLRDLEAKGQARNVKGGFAPTRALGDCTSSNRISC